MIGNIVKAVAIRNMTGILTIGDEIEIESILYDEPKLICREIWGYKDGSGFVSYYSARTDDKICKIFDAVYARKGSLKTHIIYNKTTNLTYNSNIVHDFKTWFKKLD